jgi:hypothetical protein
MNRVSVLLIWLWFWLLASAARLDPLAGADLESSALFAASQEEAGSLSEAPAAPDPSLIAGVSYEEALAILEWHKKEELRQLPGVEEAGLGTEGIVVYTANPEALPAEVEGVPLKPLPPLRPAA